MCPVLKDQRPGQEHDHSYLDSEPATLPAAKEGQESPQRVLLSGIQGDFNDSPFHDCAGE